MNVACRGTDIFSHICKKCNGLMVNCLLNLLNTGDIKFRFLFDLPQRLIRHQSQLIVRHTGGDFHLQPSQTVFITPDLSHFRRYNGIMLVLLLQLICIPEHTSIRQDTQVIKT